MSSGDRLPLAAHTEARGPESPKDRPWPAAVSPGREQASSSADHSHAGVVERRISVSTKQRNLGEILQEFSQHRKVMQQELQKLQLEALGLN